MSTVGKHIKALRTDRGLTQEQLAERIYTTRQTVSNYENGKSDPDLDTLAAIAAALDTDLMTVIYGERRLAPGEVWRRSAALGACVVALIGLMLFRARVVEAFVRDTFIATPNLLIVFGIYPALVFAIGYLATELIIYLCRGRRPAFGARDRLRRTLLGLLGAYVLLYRLPVTVLLAVDTARALAGCGAGGAFRLLDRVGLWRYGMAWEIAGPLRAAGQYVLFACWGAALSLLRRADSAEPNRQV